jgi:deoxycytidine triphosphate deaminase
MPTHLVNHTEFAKTEDEARERFLLTKETDPFPEVAAALLNSADIYDYVRMTGMLYPFQKGSLKSGSYEAAIRGRCIWWDQDGKHQEKVLSDDNRDEFTLRANSIAFVQVEPFFRLPDYIALRFNLKITHVHRGILLGTGPLVDPGFEGRLLIPLHNLTTNEYTLRSGEGLIWIEFTKTSPLPIHSEVTVNALGVTRYGRYIPFPESKKNLEPEYYLAKASPHSPIRSSISQVVKESEKAAKEAADASTKSAMEAETTRKRADRVLGFFSVAAVIALATAVYATWDLIHNTWKTVIEVQQQLQHEIATDLSQSREVEQTLREIKSIELKATEEVAVLHKELGELREQINGPHRREKQDKPKSIAPQGQQPTP